ncbi:unnamed protein product [Vitrella brassicaformis CCMP3155]|uniref:Uncharacterized protein n=1 Tax=Vitrella brassicaformis (strain CCMP3155) TaxID=1169540 RepID=A0A0G4GCQ4_VITBC|nr:unnamed protein product [Vitrella brassicaformis CCMP3155]|eukprot:CEM27090.1 unnamed protein product [Vitrella brassicaformis CCMP3155]
MDESELPSELIFTELTEISQLLQQKSLQLKEQERALHGRELSLLEQRLTFEAELRDCAQNLLNQHAERIHSHFLSAQRRLQQLVQRAEDTCRSLHTKMAKARDTNARMIGLCSRAAASAASDVVPLLSTIHHTRRDHHHHHQQQPQKPAHEPPAAARNEKRTMQQHHCSGVVEVSPRHHRAAHEQQPPTQQQQREDGDGSLSITKDGALLQRIEAWQTAWQLAAQGEVTVDTSEEVSGGGRPAAVGDVVDSDNRLPFAAPSSLSLSVPSLSKPAPAPPSAAANVDHGNHQQQPPAPTGSSNETDWSAMEARLRDVCARLKRHRLTSASGHRAGAAGAAGGEVVTLGMMAKPR